ncbi:FMN-binding negative transcriptional regulator [Tenacibaculum sp. 190524A05c]|uniref:Transcriptional regulator n=1 Tax=Tenacibaculum platacis TaxID=3137852 RepID=A0ABP1EIW6_9FLAO
MYNVPSYKEDNVDELLSFINHYPLAFITGLDEKGNFVGTHIPLIVEQREGELCLIGHMMKKTDHYEALFKNNKILVVFNGPNGYVSASWGTNKSKGSTWNYMTVHVNGRISFFEGDQLINLMRDFTLLHENGDSNSPTVYDNLSESYKQRLMPHISGFEIKVEKIEGVFKLSQGVDEETFSNIIEKLEEKNGLDGLLGEEMKKRKEKIFS